MHIDTLIMNATYVLVNGVVGKGAATVGIGGGAGSRWLGNRLIFLVYRFLFLIYL